MDETFSEEPVRDIVEMHRKKIEKWCAKISEDVSDIWPLIEEYCGDLFEIDMGKVVMTIRKKDPNDPRNRNIPEDWWSPLKPDEKELDS